MTDTTVAVADFRTRLEAEVAAQALDEARIRYVINSDEAMLHGPLSVGTTILVREQDADRARRILSRRGPIR
jgi:hypothetical protein